MAPPIGLWLSARLFLFYFFLWGSSATEISGGMDPRKILRYPSRSSPDIAFCSTDFNMDAEIWKAVPKNFTERDSSLHHQSAEI
jgi:hypothetical protein